MAEVGETFGTSRAFRVSIPVRTDRLEPSGKARKRSAKISSTDKQARVRSPGRRGANGRNLQDRVCWRSVLSSHGRISLERRRPGKEVHQHQAGGTGAVHRIVAAKRTGVPWEGSGHRSIFCCIPSKTNDDDETGTGFWVPLSFCLKKFKRFKIFTFA